ncbi:MAG: hypothetical protein AB8B69_16545, partial [Chitinophagales bacterium]
LQIIEEYQRGHSTKAPLLQHLITSFNNLDEINAGLVQRIQVLQQMDSTLTLYHPLQGTYHEQMKKIEEFKASDRYPESQRKFNNAFNKAFKEATQLLKKLKALNASK